MLDIVLMFTWARKDANGSWTPTGCGCDYRHVKGWFVIPVRNGCREPGPYPFIRANDFLTRAIVTRLARELLKEETADQRGEVSYHETETYHARIDGRDGTCLWLERPKVPVYESEV